MIKEIIQTGATVESAIDDGCLLLGIDREKDEFQFDILERPRKTLFGLKTVPAKVRVYIELPDPQPEKTDVGVRVAADPVEEAPAAATEHKEKRRRNRRRKKTNKEGGEAARTAAAPAQPQQEEEPAIEPDEQMLAKAEAVSAYIKDILTAMALPKQ